MKKKKKKKPNSDLSAIHISGIQPASHDSTFFGPTTTLIRPYSPHNSSFSSVDTLCYVMVPFSLYLGLLFTSFFKLSNFCGCLSVWLSVYPPFLFFSPPRKSEKFSNTGERIHGEGRKALGSKVSKQGKLKFPRYR